MLASTRKNDFHSARNIVTDDVLGRFAYYNNEQDAQDGISAGMLVAEAAAYYRRQGKTLWHVLQDLYEKYGFTFFRAGAVSFGFGFWRLSHFGERINYFVFCSQPMFYQPVRGPFTRLALWLYGEKYVELELLGGEKK